MQPSDHEPPSPSLAWRIFITPRILILKFQYFFPKAGNVFGSGRLVDHPGMHLLYAAGFWLFGTIILAEFVFGGTPRHAGPPAASSRPIMTPMR